MGLSRPSLEDGMDSPEAALRKMIRIQNMEKALNQHVYSVYQSTDGKWYTYFPQPEGGRKKVKRGSELAMKKKIIDHYMLSSQRAGFRDVFDTWIKEKMKYGELEDSTYTKYMTIYRRHFKDDDPFCYIPVSEMTDQDLNEYLLRTLRDHKVSRKAFSDLRSIIKGVFKYAKQNGYTTFSITQFFNDFATPNRLFAHKDVKDDSKEIFNEEETKKLAQYFWGNKTPVNLALLLMFQTGMRVGEVAGLKKSDIEADVIHVRGTETSYVDWKSGKRVCTVKDSGKTEAANRRILIPKQAKITLSAALAMNFAGPFVFMQDGKRIRTKQINYGLHKACRAVGIPERSTHKIRKTYASILVDNNLDSRLVMHQMGHSDISTTMKIYVKDRKKPSENLQLIQNAVNVGEEVEEKKEPVEDTQEKSFHR